MLHKNPEIILPETFSLLEKICADSFFDNFNLVGGTALALQIGHRFSIDLDFFSSSSFDSARMIDHLVQHYDFNLSSVYENTVLGFIGKVKVDFITHAYPNVDAPLFVEEVRLATTLDISAMKLNAIVNSGQRIKDFIDVFYLLTYHSMQDMLDAYSKKYAHSNPIVALKALTYFDDIDPNLDPPKMKDRLPLPEIKKRILKAVVAPDHIF